MRAVRQKVALVFEGSRGIGAAAATRLAEDGFTVALTYVSRPDKAEQLVRTIGRAAAGRWRSRPTAPTRRRSAPRWPGR